MKILKNVNYDCFLLLSKFNYLWNNFQLIFIRRNFMKTIGMCGWDKILDEINFQEKNLRILKLFNGIIYQ
jgi:hypothetical protein